MNKKTLLNLAKAHGTPLFVIDHAELRKNYALFRKHFPRIQTYYAVKVNSDPAVVETFYNLGGSFDVASMQEFHTVYRFIENLPSKKRQDFIWDKIIYANPIKPVETLEELDRYKPLVTYDNEEEIRKIAKYAPNAGLALRLRVPNTGSMVELSSKFGALPGEAVHLITRAHDYGLIVEGLSFHVGSQCTNPENYIQALHLSAGIFAEAKSRGFNLQLLDIGGGFPAAYDASVPKIGSLAKKINYELDRLFPKTVEILAEPGRFLVASAGSAVSKIIGKAVRGDKLCYYVDDGVYHTYSGIIFDHCTYRMKSFKSGPTQLCAVFGPTCDALDTISLAEQLPDLKMGDYLYSNTIGAYSAASSTHFNGFPPATVVHINR
ncbi:MAG: type III PLP-dependent enzyme [Planctomycetaceae bacterium]|nr:type III PLP-dependent enzyme [Planctomycetaceae bacterium]MBT6642794.1 type III PLP-dependent enzyme [Planctomycetaceae bacterium]MBT6918704.1 type III PLP-dependent enzyme [Planctomycetaceae bacterium]MBT7728575.1 type III PLP-dependent enzyme [Planctomycetaceae bacterium]